MLAVLITLTPGCQNKMIHSPKAKERIVVLPTMDVKTLCNSSLQLLEYAYQLHEFTREWLNNPEYNDYQPRFTTQDEWTIVKCIMEVLRTFRYWNLWMSKQHTVALQFIITVHHRMFDHIDGVMQACVKTKTHWEEDLYFAMRIAHQKLQKYYAEIPPTTGMILISAYILDPLRKLQSFKKWDNGMDSYPENETSFTTQYHEAFLMYVKNEDCPKHRYLPVIDHESVPSIHRFFPAMASRSGQSSYNAYDMSSNDDEYLLPKSVTEMTSGWSNRAACWLTPARLHSYSQHEFPQNWGQRDPNLNDYHNDPMAISSKFWIPDITKVKGSFWSSFSSCNDTYKITAGTCGYNYGTMCKMPAMQRTTLCMSPK